MQRTKLGMGILSVVLIAGLGGLKHAHLAADQQPAKSTPNDPTWDKAIKPFMQKYCNSCHKSDKASGGVALDVYQSEAHARKDRKTWEAIHKLVTAGEMPPKRAKTIPTADERKQFTDWIESSLTKVDCTGPRNPGRVTIRRLNRAEYNNTIRDLVGVTFKPADDFPSDDVGYGFDNIGDVLSLQPLMIEKYLAAADKILDAALPDGPLIKSTNQVYRPQQILVQPRSAKTRSKDEKNRDVDRIALKESGRAFIEKFNFPVDGDYIVRIRARATIAEGDTERPEVRLRVGDTDLKTFTIEAKDKTYEVKASLRQGERRVEASFLNPANDGRRVLHVLALEVEGPLNVETAVPESMKKILNRLPGKEDDKREFARKILSDFATRAFRRPVKSEELERLLRLYAMAESQGDRFDQAIKLPLKAILVSPHFLFRIEDDPKDPDGIRTISDYELATRLSYFLWSSMPDQELFELAAKKELRKPGVLEAQVKRMLKDPKSSALTENFAGQWLMLRNIAGLTPDTATFPKWDERLRHAAIRESELFFEHIVREDRSVLEFLDADYTFVNDRLSWHYGIPGIQGDHFRKVKLTDGRRGGIVTQASMLIVTSNPTRTSPVKRGKWIYENILGLTAPPPAPDVPEFPEAKALTGTVRQVLEAHRANPNCATCHAKLDPLGFGLENFDAIGRWRDTENKHKIDASGELPDGARFNGPAELKKTLMAKADLFRRCLGEKLATFALGRGLEYYDKCVLDDLQAKLKSSGDKFSALVLGIVESDPFQKRRGKRSD